jgi:hypothetical protein
MIQEAVLGQKLGSIAIPSTKLTRAVVGPQLTTLSSPTGHFSQDIHILEA